MNDDLWLDHAGIPLKEAIQEQKKKLCEGVDVKANYLKAGDIIKQQLDELHSDKSPQVVDIDYKDIVKGNIPSSLKDLMRKRGVIIVRNMFNSSQVNQWNEEISAYIDDNDYIDKSQSKIGLDKYFSDLSASKPQIYSLYWSKPQIAIRQSQELAAVRQFLNRLWINYEDIFNPDVECSYADRIRRRSPGDSSLGLSPHIDGGTVERWLDGGYNRIYRHILKGDFDKYQPFEACYRTETREVSSPAVCRMFRTYQGWTALSAQGPNDGTLNIIPISNSMAYILWRALQDDIDNDDLCGALPGRALSINPDYYSLLLEGLIPLPKVYAGDSVWWHPDVIHGVENIHQGSDFSNVTYIGAAPDCQKNKSFLALQKENFLEGKSNPDFAAEDYEVDFKNRAMVADLNELGKLQMGFNE